MIAVSDPYLYCYWGCQWCRKGGACMWVHMHLVGIPVHPLKCIFDVYLAHIHIYNRQFPVYTVYNTTIGTNKHDIACTHLTWQCTCCAVYNIMQSESTIGL